MSYIRIGGAIPSEFPVALIAFPTTMVQIGNPSSGIAGCRIEMGCCPGRQSHRLQPHRLQRSEGMKAMQGGIPILNVNTASKGNYGNNHHRVRWIPSRPRPPENVNISQHFREIDARLRRIRGNSEKGISKSARQEPFKTLQNLSSSSSLTRDARAPCRSRMDE